MMEVVVTTGAIKSCKAPVKSSPPTNQHPTLYRLDALPVAQPTVSKHWRIWINVQCKTFCDDDDDDDDDADDDEDRCC